MITDLFKLNLISLDFREKTILGDLINDKTTFLVILYSNFEIISILTYTLKCIIIID